ncbi:MAG TPA: O-methyltransferase [Candidatus Kapabacteria bacterium]|nr:O-methyltransferase [Candidatus Kapabacteria bacterium]
MKGTPLTEPVYNYIVDLFAKEEVTLLKQFSERAEAAGIPMISISEEQAKFVGFFVKAIRAKRVLDVGTLFGFSAAIMSKAMGEGGEVVSLEFEPMHASVARENLASAGISYVTIHEGPALDHMKRFEDNSFDFILIDADKINYINYLKEGLRLIKPGGVIAGDNAMAFGRLMDMDLPEGDPDFESVNAVRRFNAEFAAESSIFGVIIAVGDGMAMGVVNK